MARHVFLTGEKHIGKSTLLNKVLTRFPGIPGGFRTIRTDGYLHDRFSVHLFRLDGSPIPAADNLLFVCGEPDPLTTERFDRLGCAALSACTETPLIVMDELGPHESEAARFRKDVLRLLDGPAPILGVLQSPAARSWPGLISHPDTRLIEITHANRDDPQLIDDILSILTSSN